MPFVELLTCHQFNHSCFFEKNLDLWELELLQLKLVEFFEDPRRLQFQLTKKRKIDDLFQNILPELHIATRHKNLPYTEPPIFS